MNRSDDLISRQSAITLPVMPKEHREYQTQNLDDAYEQGWFDLQQCIEKLPSEQQTLYGYRIEHLALIARVMEKENVTPEKAIECFKDIERIVQMIMDEQKGLIKRAVREYAG